VAFFHSSNKVSLALWRALPLILLIVLIVAVGFGTYRKPLKLHASWGSNLLYAHQLVTSSTFSGQVRSIGAAAVPQRGVPPGYPVFLAAMAKLDARVAEGLACYVLQGTTCSMTPSFDTIIFAQIAAGVAILLLVHLLAVELTGRLVIGYATVLFYIGLGRLGEHAGFLYPYNLIQLLLIASLYCVTVGYRRHNVGLLACAGMLLGVAALFHPYYVYLIVLVPSIMAAALRKRGHGSETDRFHVTGQIAFVVCGLLVLLPWAVRNFIQFGDPMLTDIYEARYLAHRLAYNGMPGSEWMVAIVNWIPTNGDQVARILFGEATQVHWSGTGPGTYFHTGEGILAAAISASSGRNPVYQLLIEHLSPWRHLAVTPVIFTRGMWGSHGFFAYIGMACLPQLVYRLLASPRREAGLALLVTAGLLVLVHALLTPNSYTLNTPMLFLMALALGNQWEILSQRHRRLAGLLAGAGILLWAGLFLFRTLRI